MTGRVIYPKYIWDAVRHTQRKAREARERLLEQQALPGEAEANAGPAAAARQASLEELERIERLTTDALRELTENASRQDDEENILKERN
jgi:hypothetical protein